MNYYDKISEGYDELHKEEQLKKIKIIKQHLDIKQNSKILDLGCGPYYGKWDGDVTGVDPSSELLKLAANKGIKTYCEKAEQLSFPDDSFDYIISITAIQNFDDIEQGVKEIKRVTKPEAEVVITFLKNSSKKQEIIKIIRKHFNTTKEIEEDKDIILFMKMR
ncbi:methyltransferase domain-containing protein [Candidatus Woesearchaeota archaeon]|jgi:ubiquinone/menaquinone biosynthesis C-methylase UbiE|nr:methyltransferase domain-containing protein [Candidatus Woesearchaeota archaeon]